MVRFWDSSAVVALAAGEPSAHRLQPLLDGAAFVVWWGTPVEVASAIARKERDAEFTAPQASLALERLHALAAHWVEVEPVERVRKLAQRMTRVHQLRAADALQVAAALVAADHDPALVEFVCLDARLAAVAAREGFRVAG